MEMGLLEDGFGAQIAFGVVNDVVELGANGEETIADNGGGRCALESVLDSITDDDAVGNSLIAVV